MIKDLWQFIMEQWSLWRLADRHHLKAHLKLDSAKCPTSVITIRGMLCLPVPCTYFSTNKQWDFRTLNSSQLWLFFTSCKILYYWCSKRYFVYFQFKEELLCLLLACLFFFPLIFILTISSTLDFFFYLLVILHLSISFFAIALIKYVNQPLNK